MKPLRMSESNSHRNRRQTVAYKAIALCFLIFWTDSVATQRTGETCLLKTGDVGVCQLLNQCTTATNKALRGEMPTVCGIKEDMPIVCCGTSPTVRLHTEAPQNITQKQHQSQFTNQYYLLDTEAHEIPSQDIQVRYSRAERNEPWRQTEKLFPGNPSVALQRPQSINNNGDGTHQQGIARPGNSQNSWQSSQRPFTSAPPAQPPFSPTRPPSQTPQPMSQPLESHISKPGQARISETKCNEYSKLVTSSISALPLLPNPEPVNVEIPTCEFNSVPLIVGGEEAKLKEFPHMAEIGYLKDGRTEWNCGGSLISENFVLTAAHCTSGRYPPTVARLGDLNLKLSNDGAQPVHYSVVDFIPHPDYKPPSIYNDIALLKLDRRVEFNEFIRPACLYTSDTFKVNKAVVTGWGRIAYDGKKSDNLQKVLVSIIDNKLCNELYQGYKGSILLNNGIVQSMMCAGELDRRIYTYQGESGSPIQITRPDNQCIYSIIGVTSFGKYGTSENFLAVFTRVSSFVPWIESIVWP